MTLLLLADFNIIPFGMDNNAVQSFAGTLNDFCSQVYAGLRLFTVVLAFVGLFQAAYKVQMGGDLTSLGTQLVFTLLVSVALTWAPIWILNAEITLGPSLLSDLKIDVASAFDAFINQLTDDLMHAIGGLITEIMLGFFFLGLEFMGIISLVIVIIAFVIAGITYGATIVGYLVQICVIYIALAFLPIFLGMLLFERTRETGFKYIVGIVGILFWQLGWGMGFTMVEHIFGAVNTAMNNNGVITAINVVFGGIISACLAILESLLMWAILTKAPKIVNEAIVSGSQIGTGLVSAGASTVSSAASGAASAAGSVAMIAATGGAGAPAAGAAMGGKGAQTAASMGGGK
jgi:hypothetical protein